MAIILTNSTFFHIPKCGGTFVRTALRKSMGADRELGFGHSIPAQFPEMIQHKKPFAFVRHPEAWYHSFWAYRMDENWILPVSAGRTALDNFCKSDDFDEFVDKASKACHGYQTSLYGMFLDSPHVELIGRTENLKSDLIRFLKILKEPFNERYIRGLERQNTSSRKMVRMSKKTREKIRKMERPIYKRYGYS